MEKAGEPQLKKTCILWDTILGSVVWLSFFLVCKQIAIAVTGEARISFDFIVVFLYARLLGALVTRLVWEMITACLRRRAQPALPLDMVA